MEQHPVPQNVTTFQFRLIGDMTLKQFGYLAGGAILAYILYKLPLPLFLNWPLAILAAIGGFGFAFLPVEERPMDVWVLSFFKSIYSPTQYVWTKNQPAPTAPAAPSSVTPPPAPTTKRESVVQNIYAPSVPTQKRRPGPLDWLFDMLMPIPKASLPQQPISPGPAAVEPKKPIETVLPSTLSAKMDLTPPPTVKAREEVIDKQVADLKKELEGKQLAESRVTELQKQITELLASRDKMEAELARLRLQTAPPPPAKPQSTYVATPAAQKGPSVRIITPDRAVYAGLPRLTSFPNVVTGIVKDGDQNLLPGVLVTVKDKEGIPLRALKTNRLGQFAASTPLPNGVYFVEIEDPRLRFTFDRAQITLNGSIVPALEIFAKSQKEITRARLEKELFGNKP